MWFLTVPSEITQVWKEVIMNHYLSLCDVEEIGKANQKLLLLVPSFLFSNYFLIFYILEKFPGHFICP